MRFKKGSKVEVFSKKEVSTGGWLCAEIIRGNGHTYSVKYGLVPMTEEEAVVERVPRKVIRPCPPPVQGEDDWVPCDLVEVFDNLSWKTARIVKVIGNDNFLVRILGLSKSLLVHKSYLRARQCWQDGKWFVIRKGMEICDERQPSTMTRQYGGDVCHVENNIQIQKPQMVSTKTLKRKSFLDSYDLEAHLVADRKRRLIENCGSCPQTCSIHRSPTFQKVDSTVYPNPNLDENNVYSSFDVATAEFSRMDAGCGTDSVLVDSTISVYNDDCTSSVGSCSTIGNDAHNFLLRFSSQDTDNIEDYCSDAESTSSVEYKKEGCSVSSQEQWGIESHRSELHAYCSTVQNLYASGPLSWEDEAKLTNLRTMLHISDDEHLKVLKNLISASRTLVFS